MCRSPSTVAVEGTRLREELLLKLGLAVVGGEDSESFCWLVSTVKGKKLKPCPGWTESTD